MGCGAIGDAVALFGDESYWRDLVAFTWNIKTAEGQAGHRAPCCWQRSPPTKPSPIAIVADPDAEEKQGFIEGWFKFETAVGRGKGILRLKNGKCWTLLTSLEELKGFEERRGRNSVFGAEHGVHPGRTILA